MPKQIIIEHPWKAVLLGCSYDIYHYNDLGRVKFIYNGTSIIDAYTNTPLSLLDPLIKDSLPFVSVLTQCQSELNSVL